MKIFLDCFDFEFIVIVYEIGLIDGVIINFSFMLRVGEDFKYVIKEIFFIFFWQVLVFVEVVGEIVDEMFGMVVDYLEIGLNIIIKVFCIVEGLKVCKSLFDEDVNVNVILIFSIV